MKAKAVARLLHAAVHEERRAEDAGELSRLAPRAHRCLHLGARHDGQLVDFRQRHRQRFGHAGADVLLRGIAAQIVERQHGDDGTGDRRRRVSDGPLPYPQTCEDRNSGEDDGSHADQQVRASSRPSPAIERAPDRDERGVQRRRRLEARLPVHLERLRDHVAESAREPGIDIVGAANPLAQGGDELQRIVGRVRPLARRHLEEHDAEAEDV